MPKQNYTANEKSLLGKKVTRAVLAALAIYGIFCIVGFLPFVLKVVVLTAVIVGYVVPKYFPSGSKTVSRVARASKSLITMSDEEFESLFKTARHDMGPCEENRQPGKPPPRPATGRQQPYVPQHYCVPSQQIRPSKPNKTPREAALEWWGNETDGSNTGMERISELISRISLDDPSKHTCVLNEYEEIQLPKDSDVLMALVGIMKENGLEADFNDDKLLTIFWAQYEDGLEAAQAHAQAY
jgi:hypothetical protein